MPNLEPGLGSVRYITAGEISQTNAADARFRVPKLQVGSRRHTFPHPSKQCADSCMGEGHEC